MKGKPTKEGTRTMKSKLGFSTELGCVFYGMITVNLSIVLLGIVLSAKFKPLQKKTRRIFSFFVCVYLFLFWGGGVTP